MEAINKSDDPGSDDPAAEEEVLDEGLAEADTDSEVDGTLELLGTDDLEAGKEAPPRSDGYNPYDTAPALPNKDKPR